MLTDKAQCLCHWVWALASEEILRLRVAVVCAKSARKIMGPTLLACPIAPVDEAACEHDAHHGHRCDDAHCDRVH